jgi:hypothetical protein
MASWNQETPLSVLEAEMGQVSGRMEVLNNRIISSFMLDSIGYHLDSIEFYLMRNPTYNKRLAYINWLSDHGKYTEANSQLSELNQNLPEGDYWLEEYNRFSSFINQKEQWHLQGKSLNTLDSSDKQTLESWATFDDVTGAIAKGLLFSNFGELQYLDTIDLQSGAKRYLSTDFDQEKLFSVNAFPNPANEYVTFSFMGSMGNTIQLSLIDQNGKEVHKVGIPGTRPVYSIEIKDLPSGIYFYRAIAGSFIDEGKLSIVK